MKNNNSENTLNISKILSHNKKQLSILFGVSVYTIGRMIDAVKKDLGEPIGTIYSAKQVQFLIETYGAVNKP